MPFYIIITLLSCVLFSVGSAMQKHGVSTTFPKISFSTFISKRKEILYSIVKNWLWVVGVIFWFLGWILHFQALKEDISVVQPLMNTQIFVVVLIGIFILKEKLLFYEWIGIGILILGAIVLSFTGVKTAEKKVVEGFSLFVLTSIIVGIMVLIVLLTKKMKGTPWEAGLAIIAGLLFSINAIYMKTTTNIITQSGIDFSLSSPYVWFKVLTTPYFLGVVIAGPLGFIATQAAFSHGRAAIVVPISATVSMLLPVISAVVVFKEDVTLLRLIGITIILIGTLFLYRKGEAIS